MASYLAPINCLTKLLTTRITLIQPYLVINRNISTTSVLMAEPLRKKKRLDPAVLKMRVEKKMMKLEREIARLESEPRQLIPILEYQLTNSDIRNLRARPGHTLEEVQLNESILRGANKLWNLYRTEQSRMETISIRRVERAQNRALQVLKDHDEELYKKTMAADDITLLPYRSNQLRKETPPNPSYTPPDGHIRDTTKKWIM